MNLSQTQNEVLVTFKLCLNIFDNHVNHLHMGVLTKTAFQPKELNYTTSESTLSSDRVKCHNICF